MNKEAYIDGLVSSFENQIDFLKNELKSLDNADHSKSFLTHLFNAKTEQEGIVPNEEFLHSIGAMELRGDLMSYNVEYLKEMVNYHYCYVLEEVMGKIEALKTTMLLKLNYLSNNEIADYIKSSLNGYVNFITKNNESLAYHFESHRKSYYRLFNNKLDIIFHLNFEIIKLHGLPSEEISRRSIYTPYGIPFDVVEWIDLEVSSQMITILNIELGFISNPNSYLKKSDVRIESNLTLRQKLMLIEALEILDRFPENKDGDLNKNKAAIFLSALIGHSPDNIRKALSDVEKNHSRRSKSYLEGEKIIEPYLRLLDQ